MQTLILGFQAVTQAFDLFASIFGLVIGAVVTVFIQKSLPEDVRLKINYYANYAKKRFFNGDFTIDSKIIRTYNVEDERVELYELSNELWDQFGVQATGMNDHFEFTRDRGGREFDLDVTLFYDETDPSDFSIDSKSLSELQSDGGKEYVVNRVRIEVCSELPYYKMKDLLFRGYDLLRDTESEIPCNLDGGTYSFKCDAGDPPEVNLLTKMDFSEIKASKESMELEYDKDSLTMRNYEGAEVDEMIDIMHRLVTQYS